MQIARTKKQHVRECSEGSTSLKNMLILVMYNICTLTKFTIMVIHSWTCCGDGRSLSTEDERREDKFIAMKISF